LKNTKRKKGFGLKDCCIFTLMENRRLITYWINLPSDVWVLISERLYIESVFNLTRVCRFIRQILFSRTQTIEYDPWKTLIESSKYPNTDRIVFKNSRLTKLTQGFPKILLLFENLKKITFYGTRVRYLTNLPKSIESLILPRVDYIGAEEYLSRDWTGLKHFYAPALGRCPLLLMVSLPTLVQFETSSAIPSSSTPWAFQVGITFTESQQSTLESCHTQSTYLQKKMICLESLCLATPFLPKATMPDSLQSLKIELTSAKVTLWSSDPLAWHFLFPIHLQEFDLLVCRIDIQSMLMVVLSLPRGLQKLRIVESKAPKSLPTCDEIAKVFENLPARLISLRLPSLSTGSHTILNLLTCLPLSLTQLHIPLLNDSGSGKLCHKENERPQTAHSTPMLLLSDLHCGLSVLHDPSDTPQFYSKITSFKPCNLGSRTGSTILVGPMITHPYFVQLKNLDLRVLLTMRRNDFQPHLLPPTLTQLLLPYIRLGLTPADFQHLKNLQTLGSSFQDVVAELDAQNQIVVPLNIKFWFVAITTSYFKHPTVLKNAQIILDSFGDSTEVLIGVQFSYYIALNQTDIDSLRFGKCDHIAIDRVLIKVRSIDPGFHFI
jgi:hypothetical protein